MMPPARSSNPTAAPRYTQPPVWARGDATARAPLGLAGWLVAGEAFTGADAPGFGAARAGALVAALDVPFPVLSACTGGWAAVGAALVVVMRWVTTIGVGGFVGTLLTDSRAGGRMVALLEVLAACFEAFEMAGITGAGGVGAATAFGCGGGVTAAFVVGFAAGIGGGGGVVFGAGAGAGTRASSGRAGGAAVEATLGGRSSSILASVLEVSVKLLGCRRAGGTTGSGGSGSAGRIKVSFGVITGAGAGLGSGTRAGLGGGVAAATLAALVTADGGAGWTEG